MTELERARLLSQHRRDVADCEASARKAGVKIDRIIIDLSVPGMLKARRN